MLSLAATLTFLDGTGCPYPNLHHQFGDLLDDCGLTKLVEVPTRERNTLDLMIIDNSTIVCQVRLVPGISDHDCPLVDLDIRPIRHTQKQRKIPLYRKARWEEFEIDLISISRDIDLNKDILTVGQLWCVFKTAVHDGIEKHHTPLNLQTKERSVLDHTIN